MRSERPHRPRSTTRRRSNPVAGLVGLLVITLVAGAVLVAGGAYLGPTLIAVNGPAASLEPTTAPSHRPVSAAATRPPRTLAPVATPSSTPAATPAAATPAGATPFVGLPTRRPTPASTPAPTPEPTAEPSLPAVGLGIDTPIETEADVSPAPTRTPRPWSDLRPRPKRGAFSMDLYRTGDMAPEATPEWCVPAAMLTMINVVKNRRSITSYDEQKRLYALARRHSTARLTGAGAEPEGWAEGLNREGIGPYIVHVSSSRRLAVKQAARAIRLTGRPVGLLAWRGAHSMVMTGFKATGDPAFTDEYEVTDVVIADVWWPRVSSIWGESLPPGSTESFDRLAQDFLPWRRPDGRYPAKDGRFVMILPVRKDGRYDPSQEG